MANINRTSLSRFYRWLRHIKTWQLLIILVIGLVVSASLLRLNSLEMKKLTDAVVAADQSGDRAAIKTALVRLQQHIAAHMNTTLTNGIYLEKEYDRALEVWDKNAQSVTNPNAAVYQQASIECRSRFVGGVASFRNDYVACVAERVKALGVAEDPSKVAARPQAQSFHYDFASPLWSPDAAGFSVLFCGVIFSVIVLRILAAGILRAILKHRFKSIS